MNTLQSPLQAKARLIVSLPAFATLILSTLGKPTARAEAPTVDTPFGISTSASSTNSIDKWGPQISAAGVTWLRGFRAFSDLEPKEGEWKWESLDKVLNAASASHLNVSGMFLYGVSWIDSSKSGFPVANLPAWSEYASNVVKHCAGKVKYYEVWNEPPNFARNAKAADYAKLVVAAYDAAKAADSTCQIGLCAASSGVNWLAQTIAAGAADHFDYITVHPYEALEVADDGAEAEYMAIVPTIRKMLAALDPKKQDAPIWFTESGTPADKKHTPEDQARMLVKLYTMAIAQGVVQVNWFEGKDGDSGPFGLIDGQGKTRLSYTAMSQLTRVLGPHPKYLGWLSLDGKHYGFLFQGATGTVLSTWAARGTTAEVKFGGNVEIVEPATGATTKASSYALTEMPVLVLNVPPAIVSAAAANRAKPYLNWGGDYAGAKSVSIEFGPQNKELGLHQIHPDANSTAVEIDGVSARDCSKSGGQNFIVDPAFFSFTTRPIVITAVVRRKEKAKDPGFNLKYESTPGWKGPGWYTVPQGSEWVTKTWKIEDPLFVGLWGYQFGFNSDGTEHSEYYIRSLKVELQ